MLHIPFTHHSENISVHNYAYSSCNLFTSYDITTYLILMVVYGFYFCFFATDLGCFLVLWKLLLVRFCVVKCILFSAFSVFCITSFHDCHHLQYQEITQILGKSVTPSHHQTFLLFFHILLPWRKGFLQMCVNRATTRETKIKSVILKVNPIRPEPELPQVYLLWFNFILSFNSISLYFGV